MHARPCGPPRLKKFEGRPGDISPKARLLNLLGYRLPFDRHDWTVDRCGQEVRCEIALYFARIWLKPVLGVCAHHHKRNA